MRRRYTVAVDFDGVLHEDPGFTKPWEIRGEPIIPTLTWLHTEIVTHFDVVIHSTRCNTWRGRRAMRRWLMRHAPAAYAAGRIRVEKGKPPALVYIDDRAWRFLGPRWMGATGIWASSELPSRDDIHRRLRPWHKRKATP